MDLKEFLHRNFSKYSDVYSQTIAAGSPQSLAAIEATGSNGNFKWISAKTLAENRSNRSPEEEKALQTLLKPNNVTAGTPSRRRRVESTPGSPASVNSSSINFKRNPHLRPALPSIPIPFTPDKNSNESSNLHLRTESPSYLPSTSPTPSLGRRSESPFAGQRRASSSQYSSLHPSFAASTPRSSLIAEASPDQM